MTGKTSSDNQRTTTVVSAYNNHVAPWLIGQLTSTTSTVSAANKATQTNVVTFPIYDGRGRLTQSVREPNGNATQKLTTNIAYDTYGNVTRQDTVTGDGKPLRRSTTGYTSATHFRFPSSATNALGQTSKINYDAHCDAPRTTTDINGNTTTYEYDNFCRVTQVTAPTGIASTTTYTKNPHRLLHLPVSGHL